MPTINPTYQEFFDLPDGTTIGVTRCVITDASNTIPVTPGQFTSEGAAGVQLIDTPDAVQLGSFYLFPDGSIRINNVTGIRLNKPATFVTIHKTSNGVT